MRQRPSIREKVCIGATRSALSWLAECDGINGTERVDRLMASLNQIGATLNDFFLVLIFSYTDNLDEAFEQVRRVRANLECNRQLHYEDVVDEEGQSIFVN